MNRHFANRSSRPRPWVQRLGGRSAASQLKFPVHLIHMHNRKQTARQVRSTDPYEAPLLFLFSEPSFPLLAAQWLPASALYWVSLFSLCLSHSQQVLTHNTHNYNFTVWIEDGCHSFSDVKRQKVVHNTLWRFLCNRHCRAWDMAQININNCCKGKGKEGKGKQKKVRGKKAMHTRMRNGAVFCGFWWGITRYLCTA